MKIIEAVEDISRFGATGCVLIERDEESPLFERVWVFAEGTGALFFFDEIKENLVAIQINKKDMLGTEIRGTQALFRQKEEAAYWQRLTGFGFRFG